MKFIPIILIAFVFAIPTPQDKKQTLKEQSKRSVERIEGRVERPDTLVSRIGLIQGLREQQKAVKDNAERAIRDIEMQIQTLEIQTAESLWVNKSIYRK